MFTECFEKHASVSLKLLTSKHYQVAKLTCLPFFFIVLYPCFLIYFSEALLMQARCFSVSLTEILLRMCQWRGGRKYNKKNETKGECVIMKSVCFKFERICNLTHFFFFLSAVGDGMGWQWFNNSNTFDFFTLTLMFPLLPMVTFKHTIFHSESRYRNMRRALCTEHRQSWTDTECCHKGCSGFTAGDIFYTARS